MGLGNSSSRSYPNSWNCRKLSGVRLLLEKWWSSDNLKYASARGFDEGIQSTRKLDGSLTNGSVVTCSVPSVPALPLQYPRPFVGSRGALRDAVILREEAGDAREAAAVGMGSWGLKFCLGGCCCVTASGELFPGCWWLVYEVWVLLHYCWEQCTVQNGSDTEPAIKRGLFSLLL